jgi:hypothetical protein
MDACLRDIVRSGNWFSEQYNTTGIPHPTGVRPSFFGASMMIDFVMMKNGFRYGNGTPMTVNVFDGARSITGIHFGDKEINISRNINGDFLLSGSYIKNSYTQPSERGQSLVIERQGVTGIQHYTQQKPFTIIRKNERSYIQFHQELKGPVYIRIFDISGRIMQHFSANSVSTATCFPIKDLNKGIYLVALEAEQLQYTEKFIY